MVRVIFLFFTLFPNTLFAQMNSDLAVSLDVKAAVQKTETTENSPSDQAIFYAYKLKNLLLNFWESHSKNVFSFNEIQVIGSNRVSRKDILNCLKLSDAGQKSSRLVWLMPLENFAEKLEEQPWIKSAELRWSIFPLRLFISLQEEEPWVIARYQGQSWLVSKDGDLLQSLEQLDDPNQVLEMSSLPRLEGLAFAEDEALRFFSSERERLNFAIKLVKLLDTKLRTKLPISVFTLLDDGSMILEPQDANRYPDMFLRFKTKKDLDELLARYFATLDDLDSRNEKASEIDLRFAQQVIVR